MSNPTLILLDCSHPNLPAASKRSSEAGMVRVSMWERLGTPWKLVKPGEREPASQGLPSEKTRVRI